MTISKYAKWIEVEDDVYALFNSILMQVIFVDEKTLNDIKEYKVNEDDKKQLTEFGIYAITF